MGRAGDLKKVPDSTDSSARAKGTPVSQNGAYARVRLGGVHAVRKVQRLQDVCFSTAEGPSRQVGRHPEQDVSCGPSFRQR